MLGLSLLKIIRILHRLFIGICWSSGIASIGIYLNGRFFLCILFFVHYYTPVILYYHKSIFSSVEKEKKL